ncbi:MAG TPA: Ig-like domain-containing protein, partial [Gemmatimonadaceae bacterium]|nr:Ig-like domain-containing protein [Gemmatimonadaceae bacterium]
MSTSAIRVLAVAAVAAAGITCTDSATGLRTGMTAIALAPSFAQAPDGGPDIDIAVIAGTLRSGTDSLTVTAPVEGDSAILEFANVPVTGDSTRYTLRVSALDAANNVVFASEDTVQVKPGTNEPVVPVLEYVAADANATSIDITDAAVTLDWAGALAGDVSCLNRAPKTNPVVTKQLSVTGQSAGGQAVTGVRVGWTSRDTTVATVDENGLVRSRCSNKSTWVVARTFLDKADSVQVTVTAPPFSLLMSPDSVNVARGATVQLAAVLVDENGNTATASAVNWTSSSTARATVSSTGLVTGVTNGRVLITARSGDRTTVGVVHVVRPAAAKVVTIPEVDTLAVGNTVTYYAKAYDANNRIIGDASGFQWSSSDPAVASVTTTGVVKALSVSSTSIIVSLDGKKDTLALNVQATRPGGSIKS